MKGIEMSDIPKSRRAVSSLEAIHQAYKIRTMVTNELMLSFGYSQKREDAHIKAVTKYISDPDQKREQQDALMAMECGFDIWVVQQERTMVMNLCRGIVQHLIKANTIYPTYLSEFEERRIEMDRAMGCCNGLQQELKYMAEVLPADKNRYMNIVIETEREYRIIRGLRQSDNRFLKYMHKSAKSVNTGQSL
jgi:hypothetical protein